MVGEADSVNPVSASAHIRGPKGVSPGQKALLQGTIDAMKRYGSLLEKYSGSSADTDLALNLDLKETF